jgi:predicted signal transduction protein with EAL and GGDEF domain
MSHADTALYRAKQDGRGIYRYYSAEMGAEVRERRLLEHDLRHAVSRNELHLVYQPQVDIESGDVTGFRGAGPLGSPRPAAPFRPACSFPSPRKAG